MNKKNLRKFCVAPMMGYTTPHARKLYRILSKDIFLFTEMIPSATLLHSRNKNLLIENNDQNPIAMQIGGSDPKELFLCAKIAKSYNYDEINLNVGCPSKAVQKGRFGACLMKEKILVKNCLESMNEVNKIDVSMKCRIGIGKDFNYNFFAEFIEEVSKSGIKIIYVHARNAILNGLNPKNNRIIPPLNYEFVSKIKKEFPNISFIINGGIDSVEKALELSQKYQGVMVGRMIKNNPLCLAEIDKLFFENAIKPDLQEKIILQYFKYIKSKLDTDSIFRLLSPLLGILFAQPHSKKIKIQVHSQIKNNEIDSLESSFMQFINQKSYIN
tara:strand:+ start:573 stop:1556 length:984 start_codon:yes stop_codon:yes gene_type:complete